MAVRRGGLDAGRELSASRWTTADADVEGGIRSGPAVSEETQPVYAVVTLNYRVSDQAIQELYTEVGAGFFAKVVAPRVFQVFKNETVKFKSVSVAPNREQIRKEVQEELDRQLDQFSIDVVDFLINDLEFPKEFTEAIERKQVATQDALAAQPEGRAVEGRGAAGDRARAGPGDRRSGCGRVPSPTATSSSRRSRSSRRRRRRSSSCRPGRGTCSTRRRSSKSARRAAPP